MSKRLPVLSEGPPSAKDSSPPVLRASEFRGRAAMVTLGCAKNHVDSEVMLGVLAEAGYELVDDLERADVAIVNTCAFLESAVEESIGQILQISSRKESGQLRQLVVAGCLVERYKGSLPTLLPEVDAFLATNELRRVGDVLSGEFRDALEAGKRPYFLYDETMPRILATPSHSAYVKIAEGCNRPCAFCIIPQIRGKFRSRSISSVVREVAQLAEQGVREVNLIAQDLTHFGRDRREGDLTALLEALDKAGQVEWIRLLYAYPIGVTESLLTLLNDAPHVCEYLDIPLQHSSERLLQSMRRPIGQYSPRSIIERIRAQAPQVHVRTTFIVGYPGETESDVADLEEFVRSARFSNLGVFCYSREEGTLAADLPHHVPEDVKEERRQRIMLAQQEVLEEGLKQCIGSEQEVLLDGAHEETGLLLTSRTRFQAPEVDGTVIINDVEEGVADFSAGRMGSVAITDVAGYDLVGCLQRTW